ncbi:MAG: helix-turn-helix domain-containing protein, partial [Eggerthella sp.]
MSKGVKEAKAIERVLHKYMQLEEMPFTYGDGIRLTQREIHAIDAIGENPDVNITQLAEMQGVTKAAMSQMIYRLLDK